MPEEVKTPADRLAEGVASQAWPCALPLSVLSDFCEKAEKRHKRFPTYFEGTPPCCVHMDCCLQFDDAAAALASDERTAAEHMASRAEAAADKLEGRASGTYQAQMEHAAVRGLPHSVAVENSHLPAPLACTAASCRQQCIAVSNRPALRITRICRRLVCSRADRL